MAASVPGGREPSSGPGTIPSGPPLVAGWGARSTGHARPIPPRSPRRTGAIRSPAARGRPPHGPRPPRRYDERDPSVCSPAMPPASARYARAPRIMGAPGAAGRPSPPGVAAGPRPPPNRIRDPAGTRWTTSGRSGRPSSSSAPRSAPARATAHDSNACSTVPPMVTSRAAPPGGASASRHAVARPHGSQAPDGGTPRWPSPGRPASWIVSRTPGSTTSSIGQAGTKRTRQPGPRRAGDGRRGSHIAASVRPSTCQPPGVSTG
jgi:hypothetical protein